MSHDWGAVRFAFTTSDGSGPYHSSGTLRDGVIEGMTWSTGREFLMRWTGTRIEDPEPAESGAGGSSD